MNLTKKLALAVMALGLSGAAMAGTYSPPACTSHAVTIPCEDSAWDMGFEVFWAEATSNDTNYASTTTTANVTTFHKVHPNYNLGFELSGSFHFATGNDVTVRYTRLHNDNDATLAGAATILSGGNLLAAGAAATAVSAVNHDFELDAVKAEFGQHIDVGNDMDLRVHAGLEYARIEYTKAVAFTGTAVNGLGAGTEFVVAAESEMDAIGARIGTDGAYYFGSGFSAVSHASISLLAGDIDSQIRVSANTATGTTTGTEEVNFCSDSVVIPAAMLKSGINYGTDLFDGHLSVEGGWKWDAYFSSMRFSTTAGANFENFSITGPYLAVYYVS